MKSRIITQSGFISPHYIQTWPKCVYILEKHNTKIVCDTIFDYIQITPQLSNIPHPTFCLIFEILILTVNRSTEFIGVILTSTTGRAAQVPPGLSTLREELGHICGTLLRLVSHNRAVFGSYYATIITEKLKENR